MHNIQIDLSSFKGLPVNKKTLAFEFLDPIWAWVQAAYRQPPEEMQWVPLSRHKRGFPTHKYYGGGLQYGESFASACASCPAGTYPMCIHLHWDGTNSRGLFSTPIVIGVGNTNSMSFKKQFCIAYVPVVSDLGAKFLSSQTATEMKFYIRNKCIAAILSVLETAARSGVRCRLPSITGPDKEMILMPRLSAMNLDQPEAQLYFGMLNRMYVSFT